MVLDLAPPMVEEATVTDPVSFDTVVKKFPRRKILFSLLLLILLVFVAELFCRYFVGLGDPPLYRADPTVEYILKPSMSYQRFHHRFAVNRYGMRSDDFPPSKSTQNEFRVLVVGDSVIYGGVRIDQAQIDTEILKRNLQQQYGRPVVVGNVSAKSWGPVNEMEYLREFGTLDADVVVLELSSHDYGDSPSYVPVVGVAAEYPAKKPVSALTDLFSTYVLPRFFGIGGMPAGIDKSKENYVPTEREIVRCREAERAFFTFVRSRHTKVVLLQHLSRPELMSKYEPGYNANRTVAEEEGVPHVDDAEQLRAQLRSGSNPFYQGDPLHMNTEGQQILAQALQRAINSAMNSGQGR
jgi:GDSL-like Lipase/Acylhydrolase family